MSMERKQYGAVLRQLVNAAVEVVRRSNYSSIVVGSFPCVKSVHQTSSVYQMEQK